MTEIDQPYGIILSAALALIVILTAVRGARGKWKHPALAILLIGGGIDWLLGMLTTLVRYPQYALEQFDLTRAPLVTLYFWVANSVFWLLLFYALRPVRLGTWPRRIVALLAVNFATVVYYTAVQALRPAVFGLDATPSWLPSTAQFGALFNGLPGGLGFVQCAFQIWLVCTWLKATGQPAAAPDDTLAVGLRGVFMSKLSDQSTRLLCASVLLDHGGARKKLLDWLKDENRAVALELGVDLRLAAQVARFAEKRRRRTWWIYFAIFCASLLLALVTPFALVLPVIAAAVLWYRRHVEERDTFAPMFLPESFRPETIEKTFPADIEPEDVAALPVPEQNFFVYGGFMPFVGAGQDLGGWSVVIALDKPATNFGAAPNIEPFEIRDVYAAIDAGLDSLSFNEVQKMDCFFARGTDVRGDRDLLPNVLGRPVRHLDERVAAQYRYADDAKVRHYRSYRIVDWGGELALSYYIRCARRGKTLFVETKRFILTPLATDYRAVDAVVPMETKETIAAMVAGLIAGPCFVAASPLWALAEGSRKLSEITGRGEERQRHDLIERSPLYNYGTANSLRQALSSGAYGHYFQKMDGDLYNKLFEHEVLDSLVEFLDAHGIDSCDLKERQSTILNNGVMVSGGDVNAESLAVGAAARAVKKVQSTFGGAAAGKGGEA
jgi:hypothetical protein